MWYVSHVSIGLCHIFSALVDEYEIGRAEGRGGVSQASLRAETLASYSGNLNQSIILLN